jgi:hypothetical protein
VRRVSAAASGAITVSTVFTGGAAPAGVVRVATGGAHETRGAPSKSRERIFLIRQE